MCTLLRLLNVSSTFSYSARVFSLYLRLLTSHKADLKHPKSFATIEIRSLLEHSNTLQVHSAIPYFRDQLGLGWCQLSGTSMILLVRVEWNLGQNLHQMCTNTTYLFSISFAYFFSYYIFSGLIVRSFSAVSFIWKMLNECLLNEKSHPITTFFTGIFQSTKAFNK